jgi:hypothetical protein
MARAFLLPFDDAIPPRSLDNFRAPWFGYAEYGAAPQGFARFNNEVRCNAQPHTLLEHYSDVDYIE